MNLRHPNLRLFILIWLYIHIICNALQKKSCYLKAFHHWKYFYHQLPSQIFRFLEPFLQNLHWACPMFWIINLALLSQLYRSSHQRFSVKKGVLSNFLKFTGKYLCQGLFFNKVAGLMPKACNFIKKETLAQVFSCEFCEISKNTFFTEHLWTTAFDSRYLEGSFEEKEEERDIHVGCSEAALHRCSYKKVFWKYIANLPENTHAEVWFQ